jgi:Ca2+-transporting ATPase
MGIGSNPLLLAAVGLTVVLQLGTIYLPGAAEVFKTQPLSARELLACCLLSTVVFLAVEAEKWLMRRGVLYRARALRSYSGA